MIIEIRPEDAASHALPAIGFRIDAGDAPLEPVPFALPGCYLFMTGEAGGHQMFRVDVAQEAEGTAAEVERALERASVAKTYEIVDRRVLWIAGASRAAIAYTETSDTFFRARCATLVGTAAGTLLIVFGTGGMRPFPVTCERIAQSPTLRPLIDSFTIL